MPLFFGGGVGIFLLYYRIVLCFGVVNCDLVLNLVSTDGGYFFLGVVPGVVARLRNHVVARDRSSSAPKALVDRSDF